MNGGAPRAILFDLDETLTDRAASIAVYAEQFQRDFGSYLSLAAVTELAAIFRAVDGDGYRGREAVSLDLVERLAWRQRPDPATLSDHWLDRFPQAAMPRAGQADVFAALRARGITLGLITNGGQRGQRAKIERLGLRSQLASVVISEAIGVAKPDPRIFAHALAEIGCAPSEAWFVGDHPLNDVLGAQAADLHAVWLHGIHPWPA